MARQACVVSSELTSSLESAENNDATQPLVDSSNVVSKFSCRLYKQKDIAYDKDGDPILLREEDRPDIICIEHSTSSSLDLVGHQVWRGALLLADWVLHNEKMLREATVLELGSGTGLTSIAAAAIANEVIATDANIGKILPLIEANVKRNAGVIKNKVKVLELDFLAEKWSPELTDALSRTSVVIAADVIYDDDLTEAFVRALKRLLNTPPAKTLFMALEKRYVFTIADLDCVAPCFEHFCRCIAKPDFPWKLEPINCDFPKAFNYERTKELAMWKIVSHL